MSQAGAHEARRCRILWRFQLAAAFLLILQLALQLTIGFGQVVNFFLTVPILFIFIFSVTFCGCCLPPPSEENVSANSVQLRPTVQTRSMAPLLPSNIPCCNHLWERNRYGSPQGEVCTRLSCPGVHSSLHGVSKTGTEREERRGEGRRINCD